jgi:hypothetical protein
MIRVIHFDYNKFSSEKIRLHLASLFERFEVHYYDFMQDHPSGTESMGELEALLPHYQVLLIHPGVERQAIVLRYQEKFPQLRVALVLPGDYSSYSHEEIREMPLFGYENVDSIVDFVLKSETLKH